MNTSKIHILPEDLINKIAAGEVVERPASVVKELLENAIDAGATQINIEVQSAGKKLIRVSDNGRGMSPDEIRMALQRHSTSKISSLDDLFNICTLGFRGEALPSIDSVSKLKIESNPSGAGIMIEVRDLFYNTPARQKFLKADSTEAGQIGDLIAKYALAYPKIAIKYTLDGKLLLNSPGAGKLLEALVSIYGVEVAREMLELDFPFSGGRVYGYVSRPTLTRVDKNYESFYVNGRYIKNFLLNRALEEAYRTLIPRDRYPVGVIFIEIDPQQVDVNVHPAKREVKFVKTQEVMGAISAAVKSALSKTFSGGGIEQKGFESDYLNQLSMTSVSQAQFNALPFSNTSEIEMQITAVQPLIPLYQFKNTYIAATDGDDLIMIDQHAAHERILYDQLSDQAVEREKATKNSQGLLMPETLSFDSLETALLKSYLEELLNLGFDIEEFGAKDFILRAVPAAAAKVSANQLIRDILADLRGFGKESQIEVRKENVRKLVACHAAIKAGDKLTGEEMNQLIRDLYSTSNPLTCPHGRPTMIRIIEEELKKRFGR